MSGKIEAHLESLGITLPAAASPVANYVPFLRTGDHLFISGQLSKAIDGTLISGHLGDNLTVADGQAAARAAALNILAQVQLALGSLDSVAQIVRLNGFVAATPAFTDHPQVINGASDLMVEIFAERGRHTRAAIGVTSLPLGCAVEIDAIVKVAET
ncbi:MAG: RidA family protein [Alphaproteobacteria bacterium]|nr:RidA family protein [Alphaproteobacteria bacterium]